MSVVSRIKNNDPATSFPAKITLARTCTRFFTACMLVILKLVVVLTLEYELNGFLYQGNAVRARESETW